MNKYDYLFIDLCFNNNHIIIANIVNRVHWIAKRIFEADLATKATKVELAYIEVIAPQEVTIIPLVKVEVHAVVLAVQF